MYYILNSDVKNFSTLSLWQLSALRKPNILNSQRVYLKLHYRLKFDLKNTRALMSLMTHQYNIEIRYKGWIIVHGELQTQRCLCLGIANECNKSYQFIISLSCSYMFWQICAQIGM
jgi:hypothetical protein